MVDLLLILLGKPIVQRKWSVLMSLGLLWIAFGGFLFVNALYEELRIPTIFFVIPLLLDAGVTLCAAYRNTSTRRTLHLVKGAVFLIISLLIILKPGGSDVAIGILVGAYLIFDAGLRTFTANVVRFKKWKQSIAIAVVEFLLGLWSFVPWPTHWQGEVGLDVGTLVAITGCNLVGLSLRLRHLAPHVPISQILSEGWPDDSPSGPKEALNLHERGSLTVHIWTPTGGLVPLTRGIQRYIAATDASGIVSAGHAALEALPDIYISHYPEKEMEASARDFAGSLRASRENDQPGRWQPSYAVESREWCPSSFQIEFHDVNLGALRQFWCTYQQQHTYNLTGRNCSSAVAKALDVAIEGAFASAGRSPRMFIRLVLQPELWTAGWLRYWATTMAWTPGIVLDYARALSAILHLRESSDSSPKT